MGAAELLTIIANDGMIANDRMIAFQWPRGSASTSLPANMRLSEQRRVGEGAMEGVGSE